MNDVCEKCECELSYYEINTSPRLKGAYCAECYDLAIEGLCKSESE